MLIQRKSSFWTSVGTVAALSALVLLTPRRCGGEINCAPETQSLSQEAHATLLEGVALELPEEVVAEYQEHWRRLDDSASTDMYPVDLLLTRPYKDDPNRWLVFLHVIGIGYMLLGLNTVCDVYFTGALDVMVDQWKIKPDVAGATFMAAGGSAPELFTSLIGAVIAVNDVGFGTIVGSAVFNVLFVIGLCGYAAGKEIELTWWPLFRDCSYYIIGLSLLAICASDEAIVLHESIILFIAYVVYCIIMYNNPRLEALLDTSFQKAKKRASQDASAQVKATGLVPTLPPVAIGKQHSEECSKAMSNKRSSAAESCGNRASTTFSHHGSERHSVTSSKTWHDQPRKVRRSHFVALGAAQRHDARMASVESGTAAFIPTPEDQQAVAAAAGACSTDPGDGSNNAAATSDEADEEEDECDLMAKPEGVWEQVAWYTSLPVYMPIYYTIPSPDEKWFLLTFTLSLVWIATFSFFLVWWVEVLGVVCHVPTILMGFTLLAAGTSIPDAVSSVAVAKAGEGDMAISSSIGSNIFDILVGLPVPWFIKIAIVEGADYKVTIKSPFLTFYVLLLLFMVFCVVLCIHMLGWKLNKVLGLCMAVLYVIFLITAIAVETSNPDALKF